MQHDLEQNGSNLNPMYYWKYVRTKTHRSVPCVAVFGWWTEELTQLAQERTDLVFRYEFFGSNDNLPENRNVLSVFLDRTDYRSWLESRLQIDYLLCDKNDKNIWIQSQLCGVKCVFSIEELKTELENAHCLFAVEKIENWEKARDLA